jgi:hypothetical protein
MAGVVPLVVWLHTLPHNILPTPQNVTHGYRHRGMKPAGCKRPLPDGVLKIVASVEPMDGDAGVPAQPFLLQTPVLA